MGFVGQRSGEGGRVRIQRLSSSKGKQNDTIITSQCIVKIVDEIFHHDSSIRQLFFFREN